MFSRKFERRIYIAVGVVSFSCALGVSFGAFILWPERREAGYEPAQPIAFSHRLHAGMLRINCLYCHSGATTGSQATVPNISTCMNCHREVQPRDPKGDLRAEIAKLIGHWERSEPVRWKKIHDLADFVYFEHSRHISAGVACQECHGPVETMEHVRRVYGMKMRWCLECHMQDIPENERAAAHDRSTRAPIYCAACHR